jgi:hypothetical protein
MKTTSQKNALGGGYGCNRNTGGASSLSTAVPPYGRVSLHPGTGKQLPGSPKHGKHFQGAKITNKSRG